MNMCAFTDIRTFTILMFSGKSKALAKIFVMPIAGIRCLIDSLYGPAPPRLQKDIVGHKAHMYVYT